MNRAVKRFLVAFLGLVTLATVGIAFVSFARKLDSFSTAGLTARLEGGSLEIVSVDPEGAAAKAGLAAGDRIVVADGQTAGSISRPEKTLARKPFPHRLVVISHGEIRGVSLGEPSVRFDTKYLFLSFVGFLYLIIGLFTVARERTRIAAIFWALCLSSFAIYVITPAGPRDDWWKASWLAEDLFRALMPALFLHFFLLFPRPTRARRLLPLLYLPAAAYVAAQLALLPAEPTPRLAQWLEGVERFWFGYFVLYVAAVLVRLAHLLRHARDAEADKQLRWIGLGVIVGLAPFLILSALPRAFGLESPVLSSVAVVPLVFIPLAFAYAILKWRLWDVEIFVREAIGTTAAVVLGGMRSRPLRFSTTAATSVFDSRMSSAEIPSATRTTAGASSPVDRCRRRTRPLSGLSVSKTLSIRKRSSSSTEMSRRSSIVSSFTTRSDSINLPSCSAGRRGSVSVACARSSAAEAFRIVLSSGSSPPPSMRTRVVDSDSTLSVTPPTVIRSPGFRVWMVVRRSPFRNVPLRDPRSSTVRPPSVSRTMRACWRDSILSEIGRSFIDDRPTVVTGRSSESFRAAIPGAVT